MSIPENQKIRHYIEQLEEANTAYKTTLTRIGESIERIDTILDKALEDRKHAQECIVKLWSENVALKAEIAKLKNTKKLDNGFVDFLQSEKGE